MLINELKKKRDLLNLQEVHDSFLRHWNPIPYISVQSCLQLLALSASWYYQNAYDIFVEIRTQVFPEHKQMFICMFQHPLTLNALQGSIFSPYCKGFTWINLNQKDLPKEKHICFTISSTQGVLPVLQKPRGKLGRGTDQTRVPAGSRNQWRFQACLLI